MTKENCTVFAVPAAPDSGRMGTTDGYFIAINEDQQVFMVDSNNAELDDMVMQCYNNVFVRDNHDLAPIQAVYDNHLTKMIFHLDGWDINSYPIQRLLGVKENSRINVGERRFSSDIFKPYMHIDAGIGNWGVVLGNFEINVRDIE